MLTLVWRRFNNAYRLTVAAEPGRPAPARRPRRADRRDDPAGPRAGGAHGRAAAVAAVRLVPPRGRRRGQAEARGRGRRRGQAAPRGAARSGAARSRSTCSRAILPGTPDRAPAPPRRARWKSPLRYRNLSWGRNDRYVVTTSGRLRRVTAWVPFEKVQSLRRVEGPVQRRLRLVTIHVDTAGRNVHASAARPRPRRGRRGARGAGRARARRAARCLARDADQDARRRRRAARRATSRGPIRSLAPSTSAERPTPQRHSVATSGETTVTGPWKYASNRQTYESPKKIPAGAKPRSSPRLGRRRAQSERDERPGEERRGGGRLRARVRVQRADEVVAHREAAPTRRPRTTSPAMRRCSGRSRSAGERDRRRRRSRARRARAPAATGSSRKTSAIATAKSGAVATATDVRDAPASRIESVNRICEQPGAIRPARRNAHARCRSCARHGRDERDGERRQQRRQRPRRRAAAAAQADPDRHRHRTEERRRGEREDDRRHAVRGRRTSRASTSAAAGSASTIPAMITAQPGPAERAEPVAREREAEDRRPHRLEREDERGAVRARPPLRPRLHEERERAREHAGHEQRAPHRPAVRHLERRERRDRRARRTRRPSSAA